MSVRNFYNSKLNATAVSIKPEHDSRMKVVSDANSTAKITNWRDLMKFQAKPKYTLLALAVAASFTAGQVAANGYEVKLKPE